MYHPDKRIEEFVTTMFEVGHNEDETIEYEGNTHVHVKTADGKFKLVGSFPVKTAAEKIQKLYFEDVISSLHLMNFKLRRFLTGFKAALIAGDEAEIDEIILKREIELKTRSRAKLCYAEDYDPNGWVGGGFLDYRFSDAKQILIDIYHGEEGAHVSN